jgi:hypothetical protein
MQIYWKTRFINESGENEEMVWVSDIESIRKYFKYQRPKCKHIKIDPLKDLK